MCIKRFKIINPSYIFKMIRQFYISSFLKDITLPTKVHLVKAMVFPVVLYGCKSWTIKKVERQRIDAFELQCWRRLFRVPWTARRSNQSILREISPEYSLERLMLKLKLQYFGHLMRRTQWKRPWWWEKLKEGGERDDRWDGWMASPIQWTWVWVNSGSWWWTGRPGMLQSMGSQRAGHNWETELNKFSTMSMVFIKNFKYLYHFSNYFLMKLTSKLWFYYPLINLPCNF